MFKLHLWCVLHYHWFIRDAVQHTIGKSMDRYLEQFIDEMMEKQVYRNGIFRSFSEIVVGIFAGMRGPQGIRDAYTVRGGK